MFNSDVISSFEKRYRTTLVGKLKLKVTGSDGDSLLATVRVGSLCVNSQGFLHGGMSIYLCETLSSFATLYLVRGMRGKTVAAVSVKSDHVSFGRHGDRLTLVTRATRVKSSPHVWVTEIKGPDGAVINRTKVWVVILDRKPPHGAAR